MSELIGGVEYVTPSEACERLAPDVKPETLRNWYAPRRGRARRVHRLLTPAGQPVRVPSGRPGAREILLPWAQVVQAERETRLSPHGGRPRTSAQAAAVPAEARQDHVYR